MPVQPTYPGVYIEELPSGVRTIAGVSTSVAAFVGTAKQGPINDAVHVLSYSDFERGFGGLDAGSEMSYAVRQFFLNGGTDAWVVRLAKGAVAAQLDLSDAEPKPVLRLTARAEGFSGNGIEVRIDYATPIPASTFNLTLIATSPDGTSQTESFPNLSLNSADVRYAVDAVNGGSQLVTAERLHDLTGLGRGTSTSGAIADVAPTPALVDPTHNRLAISVDGGAPVVVQIDPGDLAGGTAAARIDHLCAQIKAKVIAQAGGNPSLTGFNCAASADEQHIVMTSGTTGELSSVRVLAAPTNDAAARLLLGWANGGQEADAVALIRPVPMPDPGTLTSGTLSDADLGGPPPTLPAAGVSKILLSLDGGAPETIDLGTTAVPAGSGLADRLASVASLLQSTVQAKKPSNPAFSGFACSVNGTSLVLASGTRGAGSSVQVSAAPGDTLATRLKLLAGATTTVGAAKDLQGGNELPVGPGDIYNTYIGDRAQRAGIYALEEVDLFNLLCLPGITDPGVLADANAYCVERRAFFLIDAPPAAAAPSDMVTAISGTSLPKSDHAAVYYPWLQIADPQKSGKLRTTAPCGTMAGLYARIDAARGVWKAPAGTEATLAGVQALTYTLTDRETGTLNPLGVNCLRALPVFGPVSWGARTLRGADQLTDQWKYIPVRRLALYIEESLFRGTQWVVFEPNDEPLWAQIRLNIGAFLQTLFRQGAFQGGTPREAYFVKCDKDTTTQDDVNRGVVNILVGFAPLKPAEFVYIQIQQLAGQTQA